MSIHSATGMASKRPKFAKITAFCIPRSIAPGDALAVELYDERRTGIPACPRQASANIVYLLLLAHELVNSDEIKESIC